MHSGYTASHEMSRISLEKSFVVMVRSKSKKRWVMGGVFVVVVVVVFVVVVVDTRILIKMHDKCLWIILFTYS